MKNISFKKNGITLIALVITIIVMLILVSIGLSVALGKGGLIEKAITGKEESRKAKAFFELKHDIANVIAKGEEDGLTHQEINQKIQEEFAKPSSIEDLKTIKLDYGLESEQAAKNKILNAVEWIENKDESQFPPVNPEERKPMTFVIKAEDRSTCIMLSKAPAGCKIDWGDGNVTDAQLQNEHEYPDYGEYTVKLFGDYKGASVFGNGKYDLANLSEFDDYTIQNESQFFEWHLYPKIIRIESWGENNFGKILPTQFGAMYMENVPLQSCVAPLPRSFESLTQFSYSQMKLNQNFFANAPNLISFAPEFFYEESYIEGDIANFFKNNPKLKYVYSAFKYYPQNIPDNMFANNKELVVAHELFSNSGTTRIPDDLFVNNPKLKHVYRCFAATQTENIPQNLFAPDAILGNIEGCFDYSIKAKGIGPEYWKKVANWETNTKSWKMIYSQCKNLSNYYELPENAKKGWW